MVDLPVPADAGEADDPWAWVRRPEDTPFIPAADSVTAVLVTRDAAGWLGRALSSLRQLDPKPGRIIAVDNGSADETPDLLRAAQGDGLIAATYAGDPAWGFGQAVASALALDADAGAAPAEWLWLLHDDIEPLAPSLGALVRLGEDRDAGVVVPKLLQFRRRGAKQIQELGASVTGSGARTLAFPPGDIDQGQADVQPTLGASSCGLLVRRSLWDTLGGFDARVPLFRDGLEFCWRANLAGAQVLTCPDAEILHREVGRAGLRAAVADPTALDRRYGMITVSAHRRGLARFVGNLGMVLAVLFGALGFLLGKAPSRAAANLRALRGYLGSGAQVRSLRRRIGRIGVEPAARRRTSSLRHHLSSVPGTAARVVAGAIGDSWYRNFGAGRDGNLDDLIGDDFEGTRYTERPRRPWLVPTLVAWAVIVLLALVAARHLFGLGHLASSSLAPAPDSLAQLYRTFVGVIPGSAHDVGPAWSGWALLASTIMLGQPEWFVTVLVVLSVPLAMVPSYLLLRSISVDRRAQLVGAALAATVPALIGATARGALGTLILALLLPLLGLALVGWRRRGTVGLESWRAPFLVGLLLSIWAAFQPLVWLVAVVVGAVAVILARRRGHALRVLVALAIALLLNFGWLPTLFHHPGRLLTGEDPALTPVDPVSGPGLLLGRTPGPGLPPMWVAAVVFGIIWLLAVAGVALRPRSARGYAFGAAGALLIAGVLGRVLVPVSGAVHVRPSVLPWVLIAFDLLICAAVVGFDRVAGLLSQTSFGARQGFAVLALVLASAAALVSVGSWTVSGLGAPLHRQDRVLPIYVAQAAKPPASHRVLVIDASAASPTYVVVEGDGGTLGGPERGAYGGGSRAVHDAARQLAANLVAGRSDQAVADQLAALDIAYVVLRGAGPEQAATVGSVPGLQAASGEPSERVWRVLASDTGRSDVTPMQPTPAEPRAGFAWWALVELLAFLAVIVLAAPSLRRAEARDPEAYARRAGGGRRAIVEGE